MKSKMSTYEIVFFTGFALFTCSKMLTSVNDITVLLSVLRLVSTGLALFAILLSAKELSFRTISKLLLLIVLSLISNRVTGNDYLTYFALFAIAARKIEFNKLIKIDLIIKIILICAVISLYFLGLAKVSIITTEARGIRYGLGFSHPNQLAVYLLACFLDIIYLAKKLPFFRKLMIASVFYFMISTLTDSRCSEASVVIAFLLSIVPYEHIKNKKVLAIISSSIFWMGLAASLFLAMNISNPFVQDINKALSGRISLNSVFLESYGVKPFGNLFVNYRTEVNMNSASYILDSAYMQLLIRFGIIMTLCFGMLYSRKTYKCAKDGRHQELVGLLTFLFFGLMETGMLYIHQNTFLLSLLNNENGRGVDNE